MAVAVRPFSQRDAAKRIFDAARPLKAAGVAPGDALHRLAATMRDIVTGPMVKGDRSTRLTAVLDEPYLRWCRRCGATHPYEMPFRLAALYAGLELEPGTSPPVLRPVPAWPSDVLESLSSLPEAAGEPQEPVCADVDVVRQYLHLLGPATSVAIAAYLDAPVRDVEVQVERLRRAGQPVDVAVGSEARILLAEDVLSLTGSAEPTGEPVVRLLGPFDLFLHGRDRDLMVPDAARRTELWPVSVAPARSCGTVRSSARGVRARPDGA